MPEEIAFEVLKMKDFQLSMARDLDLGSGHTAHHRASLIDLYLDANCIEIEETFCGRTYVHMYGRTNGWTFETDFIRSTNKGRSKNISIQQYDSD